MNVGCEAILAVFLLSGLMLVASSRLLHCIRIVALQGFLLGILPLALQSSHGIGAEQWLLSGINIAVKGIALPWLLLVAMRKAGVRRELEPLVGYAGSLGIALVLIGVSFWVGAQLPTPRSGSALSMPVAFSIMEFGVFMVIARRKAITQVIGFLTFENGISLFGTGLMLESGLVVELGILLDVFVLIFVMGIAVFQISREFEHIDADKLNKLGDWSAPDEPAPESEIPAATKGGAR